MLIALVVNVVLSIVDIVRLLFILVDREQRPPDEVADPPAVRVAVLNEPPDVGLVILAQVLLDRLEFFVEVHEIRSRYVVLVCGGVYPPKVTIIFMSVDGGDYLAPVPNHAV